MQANLTNSCMLGCVWEWGKQTAAHASSVRRLGLGMMHRWLGAKVWALQAIMQRCLSRWRQQLLAEFAGVIGRLASTLLRTVWHNQLALAKARAFKCMQLQRAARRGSQERNAGRVALAQGALEMGQARLRGLIGQWGYRQTLHAAHRRAEHGRGKVLTQVGHAIASRQGGRDIQQGVQVWRANIFEAKLVMPSEHLVQVSWELGVGRGGKR